MHSNYKALGKYIKEVKNRNTDGSISTLLGVNIDKYFMPSVANIVGTDLTKYKVVKRGQFACNRMHVGRDKRLPVALSTREEDFLVSPAYNVFEIKDKNILNTEYLMMWFSRNEFDRNAWFYTDADVRGGLHWKAFCEMTLPVPSLEKQKEIVAEYNTIANRIKLNEQLNKKLEETAQAIYKQWFVEFEFPDENGKPYKSSAGKMVWNEELGKDIPKGWQGIRLAEYCKEMKSGGTPNRSTPEYWNKNDLPWLKTGEVCNSVIIEAEESISNEGLKNSSAKILPVNAVLMAMYGDGKTKGQVGFLKFVATTNQACCAMICKKVQQASYLYYHLLTNRDQIVSIANGGAQENLSKAIIEEIRIPVPLNFLFEMHPFTTFLKYCESLRRIESKLIILKNVILQKMSKAADY